MMELPEDVKRAAEKEEDRENNGRGEQENGKEQTAENAEDWDLSGSISDCIKRNADRLSAEEMAVILKSLEDGLTDRQIRHLITLQNPEKMERYRKIFAAGNRG
jgi:type IV secretion system protein VirD4